MFENHAPSSQFAGSYFELENIGGRPALFGIPAGGCYPPFEPSLGSQGSINIEIESITPASHVLLRIFDQCFHCLNHNDYVPLSRE